MKKRSIIITLAFMQCLSLGFIAITSPIWILIWFFTGFGILNFWFDNIEIEKTGENLYHFKMTEWYKKEEPIKNAFALLKSSRTCERIFDMDKS